MRPLLRHKDRVLPHFLPKKKYKNWRKEKKIGVQAQPESSVHKHNGKALNVCKASVCAQGCVCVGGVRVRVQEGKGASVVEKKMD
jgi:hypothetical protein